MDGAALILAAGGGTRMGPGQPLKTMLEVGGRPLLSYSIEAFAKSGVIREIIVAVRDEDQRGAVAELLTTYGPGLRHRVVLGGARRQDSVAAGLASLTGPLPWVYVHDGARPLITPAMVRRLREVAVVEGCAVLARRVTDTMRSLSGAGEGEVVRGSHPVLLDRDHLLAMETPQVFDGARLRQAYAHGDRPATDDAEVWLRAGNAVTFVVHGEANPKLTYPADRLWIEYLLTQRNRP